MASPTIRDGVQTAGDVDIVELTLITTGGVEIDLKSFMVELNLTEDIFSPALYGNLMVVDAINLIEKGPVFGEEYLRLDMVTPGTGANIAKTFKVYAVTDRRLILDDKKQGYILHFCSPEVFVDVLGKVYKTFEGAGHEIAEKVFKDYLMTARMIHNDGGMLKDSEQVTAMEILTDADNKIKFTSPGWGAMKCLSWLASKSISADGDQADFLFYETSKRFYWGSISTIIQAYKDAQRVAGEFYYMPNNVNPDPASIMVDGVQYRAPDIMRGYKIMESFEIVDSFNSLKSLTNGHLANQVLALDIVNKSYQYHDFDYVDKFADFPHMDVAAPFSKSVYRSPVANTEVYFKHPGLYTGFKDNFNEKIEMIRPNRKSILSGLSSFKIEGTVPGRTDYEAGAVVYFGMPKAQPMDEKDKTETKFDERYSGLYLVTAIRHKVFNNKHMMTMEMVRDSVAKPY